MGPAADTGPDDPGKTATRAPNLVSMRTRYGKRSICLPNMITHAKPANSLILACHGGNGSAQTFASRSGLAEAMHDYGHDIAFPQAARHWADGRPPIEASWKSDRMFIETLYERQREALNRRDVPLAMIGISNGGIFCQRLACELLKPPAITVAVVSAMPEAIAGRLAKGTPANMMLVQATADRFIPWDGGEVPDVGGFTIRGKLLSADDTVEFWRNRNQITDPPRRKLVRIGANTVRIDYWSGGETGADLWRVVVQGGGHRQLDDEPHAAKSGSLQDLICRTILWYVDRERLTPNIEKNSY